jgi:SEC-C motif-containing protein
VPQPCPCTSGLAYADCCRPFHRGVREAETPTALMRSRFSAFAVGDAEYLHRTLHSEHPDRAEPKADVVRAIKDGARGMRFLGLSILDAKDDKVLFFARIFEKGKDRSFVELSTFAKDEGGWRYLAGEAKPASAAEISGLTIDRFA